MSHLAKLLTHVADCHCSVEPIWVSTGPHDVTGLEAVQDHENALLAAQKEGKTVKALLLCNPHNPLGRCYSKEVLEAYLKLCGKYKIHLIRYLTSFSLEYRN